ncbi:MAG: hypothetical protein K0M40_09165, partial [Prolixibacteraceae bacterium]|nr:hypothetical protein [Prolixibacteraceae bacterium]
MKKLISRRILSVLLFCIVSTSVFGSTETAVRNDSLLLLSKSGFDSLSQHCSELSDRSAFENTSPLTYNSKNGITSAHIALATVSVVLFFLNNVLLLLFIALLLLLLCNYNSVRNIGNALLTHFRGRVAAPFSIRRLKADSLSRFFIGSKGYRFDDMIRPTALSPHRPIAPSFLTSLFLISYSIFLIFFIFYFSIRCLRLAGVRKKIIALIIILRGRVQITSLNCYKYFAPKGAEAPVIARLRHEAAAICPNKEIPPISHRPHFLTSLFLISYSIFLILRGRVADSFSFRQLKADSLSRSLSGAKDIALFFILTLFFAFSGKDASASRLHNDRLLILNEHNSIPAKFSGTTSLFDFAQLTSAVSAPAVAITSTATGGNWSNAATWVGGSVPVAGDDVIIANGATVTIDTHTSALGSLTVGQGRSGILQFDAIAERTVTVSGIVTINSGGTFRSAPPTASGAVTNNLLVVGVSLINNGMLDFCVESSGAGIKFIGTTNGNSMFNCEGSVKTNLQETNGVILEMENPGKTLLFYPGADFKVCNTTTIGFLSIVSGIFKLASGAIPFSNPVFSAGSYTIPASGGFELSNANATITGQNGTVTNQGKIIVSSGTYNIGTASGNSSLTSNDGTFAQSGGTINIAGRFKTGGGNCNISGGTMNIATIGNADAGEAAFHISKDANLNLVGDPLITFTYPHSNTVPFNDVYIESGRYKSIAGGTFQMGTSATPALSTFFVYSEIPLDRITVFNECAIRVVNTSEGRMANTVKGTFGKVVLPLTSPENISVICNGTVPAPYSNLQAFTDAGGKAMYNCTLVAASFKFVGQTQSGTTCPYTITRTYQVTDIFGSTGTAQHLIFVEAEAAAPLVEAEAIALPTEVEAEIEPEVRLKSAMGIMESLTFTSSGTFTVPAGVTSITVQCWGGGGAGGGAYYGAGGGGGGGAYVTQNLTVSQLQIYNVTVGAGGAGGSNANGNNGRASIVTGPGGTVTANGGEGGERGLGWFFGYDYGDGGSGATGTQNGGNGGNSNGNGAGGAGGAGSSANGTNGGNTTIGQGGSPDGGNGGAFRTSNGNGNNGTTLGGGGGGARSSTNQSMSGGNGARGQVIIIYTPANYLAQFSAMNIGAATWCAGETRAVTVTVKNIGAATWTDAGPDVNIGVKWNADADYNVRVNAGGLAPGATQTYTLTVTAPASGANNLTFDVVKEFDCWFGGNSGSCGPGNTVYTSVPITVNALPTITLGANPAVCRGTTSASLPYSGATGPPNQYSIDYNAAAEAQGFTDVNNAGLSAGSITLTIPAAAAPATYNAILTVRRSATGCVSDAYNISVTVNAVSTIALTSGPQNPTVCAGSAITNTVYTFGGSATDVNVTGLP